MARLGFVGSLFLCVVSSWATATRRRRRCRCGINLLHPFFVTAVLCSSVAGGVWEFLAWAQGRRCNFVLSRWFCSWHFFALIRVCSWMLWFVAGRIWLRSPLTTVAVDVELRSGSGRSWGATQVDGRPLLATSHLLDGRLFRLLFKAGVRWDSFCSWWWPTPSAAVAGDKVDGHGGFTKDLGALL